MVTMSVTDFARNLRKAFDRIEHGHEEIVLVRNKHAIARIVPGPPLQSAHEALSDLYSTLSPDAGAAWVAESRLPSTLADELRDPWDS
ncbi:MAG: type II toxin-antitoxin system Phd/YefM family antitoxin [Chitinivibrionales bacterium]|nr:type II toxin-antitoxin system Phd/YefM family antitoxin [Chitinivibrionales bacterium]